MNRKIARRVIAKIAKREGIRVSEVREEMSKAIVEGYNNRETRGKWNDIFGEDTIPSPEEFITAIGGLLQNKRTILFAGHCSFNRVYIQASLKWSSPEYHISLSAHQCLIW